MNSLFENQSRLINSLAKPFSRYLEDQIDWKNRLIAIKGSRGVGKTTLMLKRIKEKFKNNSQCLYTSLDNLYFSSHSLLELADAFYKQGGKYLFLDEVHKYKNWSQEIKNIYDTYVDLKIIFTSSSILEILKGNADLSRRVVIYNLDGLSFREFLQIETSRLFEAHDLSDILKNHISIASNITKQIKPLAYWNKYLKHGYYPFYLDDLNTYHHRLANTINLILETDLPQCRNIDINYIPKLKKLLYMVAVSPPMQPNISKLSGIIETSRNTITLYFHYLEDAKLFQLLKADGNAYAPLSKPEKVYLHNTNLAYAIAKDGVNIGNLRETFFLNQTSILHHASSSTSGDFLVDEKLTFEIGGKGKDYNQIVGVKNSYIAADDIEIGYQNKIPLWLFGFLY